MGGGETIEPVDFETRHGMRLAADVVFARARQGGREHVLGATLCLPRATAARAPVLIWLHGGDFRSGGMARLQTRRLARHLTAAGIAVAVPQYRPRAGKEDLSAATRARLSDLAAQPASVDPARLGGVAALAAVEDAARFSVWLAARAEALGLVGRPVLGGSAAGAITALNLAHLAPWLGLERPDPVGVLSFSGGFAWPGLYAPGRAPVLALHNPGDALVPVAALRALSDRDPALELIESPRHEQGALRLHPAEPRRLSYGRIIAKIVHWTADALKRCPEAMS